MQLVLWWWLRIGFRRRYQRFWNRWDCRCPCRNWWRRWRRWWTRDGWRGFHWSSDWLLLLYLLHLRFCTVTQLWNGRESDLIWWKWRRRRRSVRHLRWWRRSQLGFLWLLSCGCRRLRSQLLLRQKCVSRRRWSWRSGRRWWCWRARWSRRLRRAGSLLLLLRHHHLELVLSRFIGNLQRSSWLLQETELQL